MVKLLGALYRAGKERHMDNALTPDESVTIYKARCPTGSPTATSPAMFGVTGEATSAAVFHAAEAVAVSVLSLFLSGSASSYQLATTSAQLANHAAMNGHFYPYWNQYSTIGRKREPARERPSSRPLLPKYRCAGGALSEIIHHVSLPDGRDTPLGPGSKLPGALFCNGGRN